MPRTSSSSFPQTIISQLTTISTSAEAKGLLELLEGLLDVGGDVLRVLDACREAEEGLPYPEPLAARRGELAVRGGRRVDRQSVYVPQRRGLDAELQRVEEGEGRLPAPVSELEGDEAAGVREHAPGGLVVRVAGQRRMVNLCDPGVGGEAARYLACVVALAVHAQRECLEAAVREPGLKRTEHTPDEFAYSFDGGVVGRATGDRSGDQVAVAREVFGRAVDDDVRAEIQGPLQAGGAEGVVHDQGGAGGPGYLGDARHVGDAQKRVGDRLYYQGAGLKLGHLLLYRPEVGGVHKAGLDAARAEDLHEQRRRRAVELLRRQDRGAARKLRRGERRVGGGHPRGEGERPGSGDTVRRFQGGESLLEGAHRRVVVAGVAVALLLAAEHAVGRLDVRVGEGGRGVDGGRDRVEASLVAVLVHPALAGVDGTRLETFWLLHGGLS